MNAYQCPGQSKRNLKAELRLCPNCNYQVEIFSDELRATCPGCGDKSTKRKLLPVLIGAGLLKSVWEKMPTEN